MTGQALNRGLFIVMDRSRQIWEWQAELFHLTTCAFRNRGTTPPRRPHTTGHTDGQETLCDTRGNVDGLRDVRKLR
jgi:hypothetical protein